MKPTSPIDEEMIRDSYARLSDEQLAELAGELYQMTAEARTILRKEFSKRKLDTSIFERTEQIEQVSIGDPGKEDHAEHNDIVEYIGLPPYEPHEELKKPVDFLQEELQKRNITISALDNAENDARVAAARKAATLRALKYAWKFTFDAKAKGMRYEEIQNGLMERGLSNEQAGSFIYNMATKAEERVKYTGKQIFYSGLVFLGGLGITLGTYSAASIEGGTYIIMWGAMVSGFTGFFDGWIKREKYKKILNSIESEQTSY